MPYERYRACWNNAVVERFLGSLKHDWVLKILQPTRKQMKEDVTAYALLLSISPKMGRL
ncbi:hypothetical protein GWJ06_11475 [Proteus sp. G4404]|uniref:hypothetical protein n=1 Tax=Proteus sp. G4404 TaxID=2698857 RepID=UPI001929B91F|nr:hypothetical protein [Proteus sp. G4404]NBM83394.1 hypothetical protein [Proteus sp. G4404]